MKFKKAHSNNELLVKLLRYFSAINDEILRITTNPVYRKRFFNMINDVPVDLLITPYEYVSRDISLPYFSLLFALMCCLANF